MENIQTYIKRLRQAGYSQSEIGRQTGLSQGAIGHLENGVRKDPKVSTYQKVKELADRLAPDESPRKSHD